MKIISLAALLCLSTWNHAIADAVYCFLGDDGLLVEPISGYTNDTETAKTMGICSFFYLKGKTFQNAPAVFYPNFAKKEGNETLDQLIARDMQNFSSHPGIEIQKGNPVKTALGTWQIRHIKNGPGSNAFETIAYLDMNKAAFLFVMSAQTENAINQSSGDFQKFLNSIERQKKNTIVDALRRQAKEDLTSAGGKNFETAYMKTFGPTMGNAMRTCFPPGTPPASSFVLIAKVDKTGQLSEATFDRPGNDVDCVKKIVQGHKGKIPPKSPFYLELEIAMK